MSNDFKYQLSSKPFSKNKAINEKVDHKLLTRYTLMFIQDLLKTIKTLNDF